MLALNCAGLSKAFPDGSSVRISAPLPGVVPSIVFGHTKPARAGVGMGLPAACAMAEFDAVETIVPTTIAEASLTIFIVYVH